MSYDFIKNIAQLFSIFHLIPSLSFMTFHTLLDSTVVAGKEAMMQHSSPLTGSKTIPRKQNILYSNKMKTAAQSVTRRRRYKPFIKISRTTHLILNTVHVQKVEQTTMSLPQKGLHRAL